MCITSETCTADSVIKTAQNNLRQAGPNKTHINYMFRPLLCHHQVVLNLQSKCTKQSVCTMGDEISFTMVRMHEISL